MEKNINEDECFECGCKENLHNHHVIPKSKGGIRTVPLCEVCHGLVHDMNFVKNGELRRLGVRKAKLQGKFKGRQRGSTESKENFRTKPKVQNIKRLLINGHGIRETAKIMEASPNFVIKVKKFFNLYDNTKK